MRSTRIHQPATEPRASAEQLLGPGHPLVAVLHAGGGTLNAIAAIAAVQLGAMPLWWVHPSYARALAIAAATVQLALALRWAMLRVRRRELCLELLIDGHAGLPLPAVRRERRRLTNPRRQRRLAATLDDLVSLAKEPRRWQRARAVCSRRVIAAVVPQLRAVTARLREGDADVRGVALLDRMITQGTSPLYGEESRPLQDELARARYLLDEG